MSFGTHQDVHVYQDKRAESAIFFQKAAALVLSTPAFMAVGFGAASSLVGVNEVSGMLEGARYGLLLDAVGFFVYVFVRCTFLHEPIKSASSYIDARTERAGRKYQYNEFGTPVAAHKPTRPVAAVHQRAYERSRAATSPIVPLHAAATMRVLDDAEVNPADAIEGEYDLDDVQIPDDADMHAIINRILAGEKISRPAVTKPVLDGGLGWTQQRWNTVTTRMVEVGVLTQDKRYLTRQAARVVQAQAA